MTRLHSPTLINHLKTLFRVGTLSGVGEGELLERFFVKHDEAAFEEILARHGPMVLGTCRRWLDDPDDVDDAFQAVFLILVQKAATLRSRNSLSSWLYSVSLKVAKRARANKACRRSRERPAAAEVLAMAQEPENHQLDRDTLFILDEEIRRLPEKQQAAIVLCLVRGKTHEAAAAELGCPLGTVKSRIAGGRVTLARRLARRGLAPSIALGTAAVSEVLMARLIPQDLVRQTLEAATRFAVSRSISGAGVTASVQNLVDGVLTTMRLARMKSIAMSLAVVGVVVGASTALVLAQTGRAPDAGQPEPVASVTPSASPAKLDLYGDPLPAGAIVRLGTIRNRQEAPICRIEFTRDDKFFVTDGDDGQLRVWDSHEGKLLRRIAVGIDALGDFALSSDGKTVEATGINFAKGKGFMRQVVFHEIATGRQISHASWQARPGFPKVAIDPDRKLLAIGDLGGLLQLLSATTGAETASVLLRDEDVKSLAFSSDRKRLAVLSASRDTSTKSLPRLRVFDTRNANVFGPVAKFEIACRNFAFSPDGSLFAVTTDGHKLAFLDVKSGEYEEFENTLVYELSFSSDGQRVVGRTPLDQLILWNPIRQKQLDSIGTSSHLSGAVALSHDGRNIAANGGPNVVHLWDIASRQERLATPNAHEHRTNAALFSRDGANLITASADKTIRIWNLATARQTRVLYHDDQVARISLSGDGRTLVAGMEHLDFLNFWDLSGDSPPAILDVPGILALDHVNEDRSILAFSGDGILYRWNTKDRRKEHEVSLESLRESLGNRPFGLKEAFRAATFFAGGTKLAAVAWETGVHIVSVETEKEIGRIPDGRFVCASPDGRTLAVARDGPSEAFRRKEGGDGDRFVPSSATIALVDSQTSRESLRIEIPDSDVWSLAFSPDSKTLAATSGWETGQIHLYEVATGKEFRTIETPAIRTPALTFTPDGSKLVCGMADTSVLVWEVGTTP
jgi:RNA polymerase sigma factor (sigma-70 family)